MEADPWYLIGLAGMFFIVAAWAVSIPSVPPLRLSLVYFLGSLLLTVYSIARGDPVFTALNSLASVLSLYNALRAARLRERGRGSTAGARV